jgi:hypothetical protein
LEFEDCKVLLKEALRSINIQTFNDEEEWSAIRRFFRSKRIIVKKGNS